MLKPFLNHLQLLGEGNLSFCCLGSYGWQSEDSRLIKFAVYVALLDFNTLYIFISLEWQVCLAADSADVGNSALVDSREILA
jgi:hypothetical protein